jgi:transposase-like protein
VVVGASTLARQRLKTLLCWLENNGENGAAGSLREGMEETLTVAKLELPPALRGFLVTTNAIENLIGTTRRVSRHVTSWRSGEMIVRWTALGLSHAEQNFRRVRGYRYLPLLKRVLRTRPSKLDLNEEAA